MLVEKIDNKIFLLLSYKILHDLQQSCQNVNVTMSTEHLILSKSLFD